MSSTPASPRWWSMFDPRTRHGQIYLLLLALRCLSAFFGHGYIHPDEWMQSGEAYFGFTLPGLDTHLPWEWLPNQALRSFPALRSQYRALDVLLPLVKRLGPLTGRSLFLVQRASMLVETVFVDVLVAGMLPPQTARSVHLLFGISTAPTTFSIRPFSNSHEASLLAFIILNALAMYRDQQWYRYSTLGGWHHGVLFAVLAIDGFFTRFTFAIFVLPAAAFFVYRFVLITAEGYRRPAFASLAIGVVAGIALILFGVRSETEFYTRFADATGTELASLWGTKWVVPPINALLYNVKTDNVAQHGLHPRWLHIAVNMPMLVGVANCIVIVMIGWHFARDMFAPTVVGKEDQIEQEEVEQVIDAAIGKSGDGAVASTSSVRPEPTKAAQQAAPHIDVDRITTALCLATVMFSLVILSLSPHQEARFLLALAFPSTLLFSLALESPHLALRPVLVRTLLTLHVAQHIIQLVLFSFLHQGALLPTLFHIDDAVSALPLAGDSLFTRYEHHLLYRTFSVPLHLVPRKGTGMYPRVEAFDGTTSPARMMHTAGMACDHTWIYAPTWVVAQLQDEAERTGSVQLVKERSFSGHVDMDHLGESWAMVPTLGWKEAFSMQKLKVNCASSDANKVEKDKARKASHEEL